MCRGFVLVSVVVGIWQGLGNDFFLGGGKNVDMPSDCQNLGGTGISIPLRQKVGGQLPPLPPRLPRPWHLASAVWSSCFQLVLFESLPGYIER